MLGIIIGVGAVLILVSVVQGYNADLTAYYEKQGVNKVNVTMTNYDRTNSTDQSGAFMDWADTALADYITGVSPSYSATGTLKYYGSSNTTARIYFGNEQWSACNNFTLNEGRDLTKLDVEGKNLTCVIGSYVADSLFGYRAAVGETLMYDGHPLTVAWVYGQANQQSDALVGCAGTLLFDAAGRVTGFIPDGTDYLDIRLASATASSVTASGGVSYRIASGAKVVVGGEAYPFASTGYVQLNSRTGKTLRLYYDENGAISYLYLAEGMLGDGSAAVAETSPAAASLARQLGISSARYAITKNGAAATASDLAKGDVGYYDALSNTLRASDYLVCGYIAAAPPNITAAQTVTVAGHAFDVLESAWDTLGAFKIGAKVTL